MTPFLSVVCYAQFVSCFAFKHYILLSHTQSPNLITKNYLFMSSLHPTFLLASLDLDIFLMQDNTPILFCCNYTCFVVFSAEGKIQYCFNQCYIIFSLSLFFSFLGVWFKCFCVHDVFYFTQSSCLRLLSSSSNKNSLYVIWTTSDPN